MPNILCEKIISAEKPLEFKVELKVILNEFCS